MARCYADKKSLLTLSHPFDNRDVPMWPLAAHPVESSILLFRNHSLARFTMLALSLACFDCVMSKSIT